MNFEVLISQQMRQTLVHQADAVLPHELCGLLIGRWLSPTLAKIEELHQSPNLSRDPAHAFEIDVGLRLSLQRQYRSTGLSIIGHYHSHPKGLAHPSQADCNQAHEPDLIWLILGRTDGQNWHMGLFQLHDNPNKILIGNFTESE